MLIGARMPTSNGGGVSVAKGEARPHGVPVCASRLHKAAALALDLLAEGVALK